MFPKIFEISIRHFAVLHRMDIWAGKRAAFPEMLRRLSHKNTNV